MRKPPQKPSHKISHKTLGRSKPQQQSLPKKSSPQNAKARPAKAKPAAQKSGSLHSNTAKPGKPASLSPSASSSFSPSPLASKSKSSKAKPLNANKSKRFDMASQKPAQKPAKKSDGKRFGKTSQPKARTHQEILSEALSPKPKPKFKAGPPAKKPLTKNSSSKTDACRLNKWIADSGLCSRREADTLIEAGEVTVNGKRVNQLGTQINPVSDQVKVRGQLVVMPRRPQTILFHKPKGVLTTRKDEQGRKTIYDCLSKDFQKLDPAGRLDRESTGALILSSDGDLIYRLTHPKYHIPKVYRVKVNSPLTPKMLDKLTEGVFFEEEEKFAKADALDWEAPDTLKMTLSTGYNRQIRRMMEAIGKEVVSLKRLSVGPISLGHLAPGSARLLLPHELRALYQAVKLKP